MYILVFMLMDQTTIQVLYNNSLINRPTADCTCVWTLHIVWLGSMAKQSILTAMEHHGIKEEARHTLSVAVREAVYHKPVLHNHHTKHAKFECKCNLLHPIFRFLVCVVLCQKLTSIQVASSLCRLVQLVWSSDICNGESDVGLLHMHTSIVQHNKQKVSDTIHWKSIPIVSISVSYVI